MQTSVLLATRKTQFATVKSAFRVANEKREASYSLNIIGWHKVLTSQLNYLVINKDLNLFSDKRCQNYAKGIPVDWPFLNHFFNLRRILKDHIWYLSDPNSRRPTDWMCNSILSKWKIHTHCSTLSRCGLGQWFWTSLVEGWRLSCGNSVKENPKH